MPEEHVLCRRTRLQEGGAMSGAELSPSRGVEHFSRFSGCQV